MEVRDEGTDYLENTLPDHVTIINDLNEADPKKYRLLIMVTPYRRYAPEGMLSLHYVPMVGTIGFGLALTVFAGMREQLELTKIPKGMQGMAIVMLSAGLLSLAFMGFSGVDGGLKILFGID